VYLTTSSSSVNLSNLNPGDNVTLIVPAGLAYSIVQSVIVANSTTNYFNATVVSYSGTTLIVKATNIAFSSSGSLNSWTINQSGSVGLKGDPGTAGSIGSTGATGATGATGIGVPAGGTPGYYLTKDGAVDYGTTWSLGAASDGSAIIYKLVPNAPQGLCAGHLIAYNGSSAWTPTRREYLVTPSIWQTRKDGFGNYPSSKPFPNEGTSLLINGATSIPGELIQISLDGTDGATTTLGKGTWWLNYSVYGSFTSTTPGVFVGSYSGLKILNVATGFTEGSLASRNDFGPNFNDAYPFHVAGFAMLIRGNTFNGYDGRGGPDGNPECNSSPDQRPLGSDPCYADGVDLYPIVCDANKGFTYNGVYFACPPI
jgi:hypothetical protein